MKMFKNLMLVCGISVALASPAMAQNNVYKNDWKMDDFLDAIEKVDCSKDSEKCRYYSVLELTALHQACVTHLSDDVQKLASDISKNWIVFKDENLKKAIYDDNPFLNSFTLKSQIFLSILPPEKTALLCENVSQIKYQVIPEKVSLLLAEKNNKEQILLSKMIDKNDKNLHFSGKDAEAAIDANNKLLKNYKESGKKDFI